MPQHKRRGSAGHPKDPGAKKRKKAAGRQRRDDRARAARRAVRAAAAARAAFFKVLGARSGTERVTTTQAMLALAPLVMYDGEGALLPPFVLNAKDADLIREGAVLSGLGQTAVRELQLHLRATGDVLMEPTKIRGPGKMSAMDALDVEEEIKLWVAAELNADQPAWVTRQSIRDKIRELTGLELSFKRISELCRDWGLSYGQLRSPPHELSQLRLLRRRVAVLQLAYATQQNYFVVDADQSFQGVRERETNSFAPTDEHWGKFGSNRRGGKTGDRLCWMHAIAEDGMAGSFDTLAELGDITNEHPNCYMSFGAQAGAATTGDYHGNFDAVIFMLWLTLRFIAWLLDKFPGIDTAEYEGRKVVLRLDNAAFGAVTTKSLTADNTRFNPLKLPWGELVDAMLYVECEALTVNFTWMDDDGEERDTYEIDLTADDVKKHRGLLGARPTVGEFKSAAYAWLVENAPTVLETDVERELRIAFHGNVIVEYNAPCWPFTMRVEYCWSIAKTWNRFRPTEGRTIAVLDEGIRTALYTDELAAPGMNQVRGGLYVPDAAGACPAADALTHQCWLGVDRGSAQDFINNDAILQAAQPAGQVTTLANLVVPAAYVGLETESRRNILLWRIAEMQAAAADVPIGQALDDADDADGDDDEDED